jgi:hypothetical protein
MKLKRIEATIKSSGFPLSFQKDALIRELRKLEENNENNNDRDFNKAVDAAVDVRTKEAVLGVVDTVLYGLIGRGVNDLDPLERMEVDYIIGGIK